MYVCVCNAVTESDVRKAVRNGVRTMRELVANTGCSSSCGRCAHTAAEVLSESLDQQRPLLSVVANSRTA